MFKKMGEMHSKELTKLREELNQTARLLSEVEKKVKEINKKKINLIKKIEEKEEEILYKKIKSYDQIPWHNLVFPYTTYGSSTYGVLCKKICFVCDKQIGRKTFLSGNFKGREINLDPMRYTPYIYCHESCFPASEKLLRSLD